MKRNMCSNMLVLLHPITDMVKGFVFIKHCYGQETRIKDGTEYYGDHIFYIMPLIFLTFLEVNE